jgi:ribose transport system permease protein
MGEMMTILQGARAAGAPQSAGQAIIRWISAGDGLAMTAIFILLVVSAFLAPSSLSLAALYAMLPFAAILGIAAIGQQLVIQQRGLDLSAGGILSLVCVLATYQLPESASLAAVLGRCLLAVGVAALVGAINGFLIVRVRIAPLVTTIGTNALLMGFVLWLSKGIPGNAPGLLDGFALGRTLLLPNTVVALIIVTLIVAVVLNRTIIGRRFVLSGTNSAAARAAGIRTSRYEIGAYVLAGVLYAIAGILLAGLLKVPNLNVGQSYLLATVAAVVVGGSSLLGGRASPVATVLGALFMTQLGQMLIAAGLERSVQYVLQGAIVILGASVHALMPRWTER